jgi:hypothetical protein
MMMPQRSGGLRLFGLSFTALFLELMMIRWTPAVVHFLAYYGNLMLISSFLGLGLGAMLAGRKVRIIGFFPVALVLYLEGLVVSQAFLAAPRVVAEARFVQEKGAFVNYLALVGVFAANTLLFIPLGQEIGQLFGRMKPLRAYGFDLGGSLCGTLVFGVFSLRYFSPVLGFLAVAVVFLLSTQGRQRLANLPVLAVAVYIVSVPLNIPAVWSPYYYITVHRTEQSPPTLEPPPDLHTMKDPPMYSVSVNSDFYQNHGTLDINRYTPGTSLAKRIEEMRARYFLPYAVHPKCDRVCVVGSGGGIDVQAALMSGAKSVDAVEIDPVLLILSHRFNAADNYSDPRVSAQINDGRAFLQSATKKYDLVVFGLLDSHALFSYSSNIRLDGFIYTVECMRRAYSLLAPDGTLNVSFFAARPWMVDKLKGLLAAATGRTPITYQKELAYILIVPRGPDPPLPPMINGYRRDYWAPAAIDLPTDDWPYLYLSSRTIPPDYLAVIGTLLGMSVAAVAIVRLTGWRLGADGRLEQGHFFFLGLGFLLLETKSIGDCSLYFGATWLVTMIVVTGVLLMVLAANFLAMRLRRAPLALYVPLLASLAALYLIPREQILALPWLARLAWALFCVPLPIFFAGLIFSVTFRESKDPATMLAANLIGATIGGFCEYLGMALGVHALLLLVMAAYCASLLCRAVARSQPAMSPVAVA